MNTYWQAETQVGQQGWQPSSWSCECRNSHTWKGEAASEFLSEKSSHSCVKMGYPLILRGWQHVTWQQLY